LSGVQRVINLLVGFYAAAFAALLLAAIAKFDFGMSNDEIRINALGAACFLFGAVAGVELHGRIIARRRSRD
jgi:hypothetical protein